MGEERGQEAPFGVTLPGQLRAGPLRKLAWQLRRSCELLATLAAPSEVKALTSPPPPGWAPAAQVPLLPERERESQSPGRGQAEAGAGERRSSRGRRPPRSAASPLVLQGSSSITEEGLPATPTLFPRPRRPAPGSERPSPPRSSSTPPIAAATSNATPAGWRTRPSGKGGAVGSEGWSGGRRSQ